MADPKKGTGKKPKKSGRRLYTDENPKDTVIRKDKRCRLGAHNGRKF